MKNDGFNNGLRKHMKKPGIDLAIWERLRERWSELQASGHRLKVDFRLLADPTDETNILAIDVVQTIDGEVVTETVERKAGEGYPALGIAGLSGERLEETYKEKMRELHRQLRLKKNEGLIVNLSPSSATSGEIKAYAAKPGSDVKSNVSVDYRHYYMLKAIREKMMKPSGKVRAVYSSGNLEFYFED